MAGSSEVVGVAGWVVKNPAREALEKAKIDVPLPLIPVKTGDLDEELWNQWKDCFARVSKKYGEDCDEQWAGKLDARSLDRPTMYGCRRLLTW